MKPFFTYLMLGLGALALVALLAVAGHGHMERQVKSRCSNCTGLVPVSSSAY